MMETTLEFVKTGIEGLDKILKGGLPKGWVVTVSGGPGTGKTTLALEFIYRGALEYNEPGLIVTFNDTKTNIIKTYNIFGWDFEKLEKDGLVSILDYSTSSLVYLEKAVETGKFTLEFIISQIMREIEEINAKRAVIDPLNALSLLFPNEFQVRKEVHKLFGLLSNMNCTSLCTFELKKAFNELSLLEKKSFFTFIGNIEGKEVFKKDIDVLVTDGFTGNIFLKTSEGIANLILDHIYSCQEKYSKLQPFINDLKNHLHYEKYPGAILSGIESLIIKCHSYSSYEAFISAIKGAICTIKEDTLKKIKKILS